MIGNWISVSSKSYVSMTTLRVRCHVIDMASDVWRLPGHRHTVKINKRRKNDRRLPDMIIEQLC